MIELSPNGGDQWRMGFAGDTFNTAWYVRAMSRPDFQVDYVTAFGDDPFSGDQRDFFASNGIGTAESPVIAGARPGLYAISLDRGERSFTYWRSEAAARQLARDPAGLRRSLGGREMIYFSGITLAILSEEARGILLTEIARVRAEGARIAFDPNYRARLWNDAAEARSACGAAVSVSDVVLPTFEDERDLFGDDTPAATLARLKAAGAKEIVVKAGAEPALLSAGDEHWSVPSIKTDVRDTTGAGDSFNGAYLYGRMSGMPPDEAARIAHEVAARVVTVPGALVRMAEFRKSSEP